MRQTFALTVCELELNSVRIMTWFSYFEVIPTILRVDIRTGDSETELSFTTKE